MADDADFSVEAKPSLQDLAKYHVDELFSVERLARLEQVMTNAHQKGATVAHAAQIQSAEALHDYKKVKWEDIEHVASGLTGTALTYVVAHLLGVDVDAATLRKTWDPRTPSPIGAALAGAVFNIFERESGELKPGQEGAERLVGSLAGLVIKGWVEGVIVEEFSSLGGVLHPIEKISHLGNEIIEALGLGRLMRVALRPLAQHLIATPLDWKISKEVRPKLLGDSTVARQWARGRWDWPDVVEELSRHGYSDARIDAIINEQRKFISPGEVALLARHIETATFDAIQYLGEAGYERGDAERALLVHETQRLEQEQDALAIVAIDAYVRRSIDRAHFETIISSLSMPHADQEKYRHRGLLRRELEVKVLTPAEAEACFLADVVPIATYRDALHHAGYEESAALALELLAETKKNKLVDVAGLRKHKTEELATHKLEAKKHAEARQAQLDEARKLRQEGPLGEWRRAVVLGLVPSSQYAALLAQHYDATTVQTLQTLAESERAAYVAQRQKAADAAKRAAEHFLNIGELSQAVYEGVLTPAQFRAALEHQKLPAADADLLTATVTAHLKDLTAAKAKRAEADARAKVKHIDLARAELLVRRGHATLAQYQDLLRTLGYDAPSIAGMTELLQVRIADDAAARKLREAIAARRDNVAVSFAQIRRAVVLGDASLDDFTKWLADHKFTVDAQRVMLAELRDDVASAAAARAKRAQAQLAGGDSRLSLVSLARAVRLGILPIARYQQHLQAAGYSADDIAVETDLLTEEIAQTRTAQARAAAALAKLADHGLSLTQLAKAVKLDEATIDDYGARALALGFDDADAQTLVNVLADELATLTDAKTKHAAIGADLKTRHLSLGELDQAVLKGALTIDGFIQRMRALKYVDDDIFLLVSLLKVKLGG
jgi:hypothetical protein